ncbi:MAG: phosphate ABC transporter substrate-binding protein PstS [Phycisphaerales bacterium]
MRRSCTLASGFLASLACLATSTLAADIRLSGAGATFPAPLYTKWVVEYQKANPDIKIDYRSIGSGGGIKAITDKTVAFGASDAPLNEKEIAALGGKAAVVQFPATAGGVVPAYNVPQITESLNLSGDLLAEIYMGSVNSWDDPRIAALNPGISLPKLAITPAYRTDGSGTTHVFTSYLATQSPAYTKSVGVGKQVKWPVGQGGKGNEGVAAVVQQTPGAIGYVELNFATANKMPFAAVQNAAGTFVKASPASISLASTAAAAKLKGNLLAANIWNQPGEGVYPIAALSYIIVYADLHNLATPAEATALVGYLRWSLAEGQDLAGQLDYAPLSEPVRAASLAALETLTFKGQPLR